MSQKVNLSSLDWDDTALIKAYDKGMKLKVKDFVAENTAKENRKKSSRRKPEWKVGDHCRAIYSGDNSWYEAKIIDIDGDMCTVEFLGYYEEAEVELSALDQSLGKKEIKKQKRNAKDSLRISDAIVSDEAASGDDTKNDYSEIQSPHHSHHRKGHRKHIESRIFDQSTNYASAENTFHSAYHVARCPEVPPNMMPTAVPSCSDVQNPSLNAMMTAWYMAGYYTALHQVQKGPQQHCCCRQSHYHQ